MPNRLLNIVVSFVIFLDQLDGAALNEDGEEDDEEGRRQEDVLERVVLVLHRML
jgi:hypothetical protein